MLLETIKTFRARYPSSVETRDKTKRSTIHQKVGWMVDFSVLSRVSTGEGYLARNVLIVSSSIRWFCVCVGKEGGSVVYLLYVYDIL